MSTPDRHHTNPDPDPAPATDTPPETVHFGQSEASAELEMRRAQDAALYARVAHPTRTTAAISWLGWHAGELTGITVPAALAATTWPGFSALSVLTALAWAAHEARQRRRDRTTPPKKSGESGVDGESE